MKQKNKYRTNPIFCVSSVLLCLVLLTTWLSFGLFAKYATSGSSQSSATVAVMGSDISIDLVDNPLYPGMEPEVIPVTLTNKDGDAVCEVSQSYSFSVTRLTENLPLTVQVYTDPNCTQGNEVPLNSDTGTFIASREKEATYYIKVTWDDAVAANKASTYATEIDYLRVNVTVTQID
ncbi:MAG: hypothetical protein LUC83_01890 [Clostridiales bacterium]|nr:hypothetical protein [Clostridiales bacterium]